jgi:hypothetical protein
MPETSMKINGILNIKPFDVSGPIMHNTIPHLMIFNKVHEIKPPEGVLFPKII